MNNNNSLVQVQVKDYVESPQINSHRKLITKKIQPFMKAYSLKPEFFEVKGKTIVFKANNATNLSNLNKTMFSALSTNRQIHQKKAQTKQFKIVTQAVFQLNDFQNLPLTTKYANFFEEIQSRKVSQVQSEYQDQTNALLREEFESKKDKLQHQTRNTIKKNLNELEKIKQIHIEELQNLDKRIEQARIIERNNNSNLRIRSNRNLNQKQIKFRAATTIQAYVKRWITQKRFIQWKNKKLQKLRKTIIIQKWWQKQLKLKKKKDKFEIAHNEKKVKYIDDHQFIILSNYSYILNRIRILLIERKGKQIQDFRLYLNINNCQQVLNEEITKDSYEFNILIDLIINQIIFIIHIENHQIKLDLDKKNISISIDRLLLQIQIQVSQIIGNKYQILIFKQEQSQIENQQLQNQQNFELNNSKSIEYDNDNNHDNHTLVIEDISKTQFINDVQTQPLTEQHNEYQNYNQKQVQDIEIESYTIKQIPQNFHPNNNDLFNSNQCVENSVDNKYCSIEEQQKIDQDKFKENNEETSNQNDQYQIQNDEKDLTQDMIQDQNQNNIKQNEENQEELENLIQKIQQQKFQQFKASEIQQDQNRVSKQNQDQHTVFERQYDQEEVQEIKYDQDSVSVEQYEQNTVFEEKQDLEEVQEKQQEQDAISVEQQDLNTIPEEQQDLDAVSEGQQYDQNSDSLEQEDQKEKQDQYTDQQKQNDQNSISLERQDQNTIPQEKQDQETVLQKQDDQNSASFEKQDQDADQVEQQVENNFSVEKQDQIGSSYDLDVESKKQNDQEFNNQIEIYLELSIQKDVHSNEKQIEQFFFVDQMEKIENNNNNQVNQETNKEEEIDMESHNKQSILYDEKDDQKYIETQKKIQVQQTQDQDSQIQIGSKELIQIKKTDDCYEDPQVNVNQFDNHSQDIAFQLNNSTNKRFLEDKNTKEMGNQSLVESVELNKQDNNEQVSSSEVYEKDQIQEEKKFERVKVRDQEIQTIKIQFYTRFKNSQGEFFTSQVFKIPFYEQDTSESSLQNQAQTQPTYITTLTVDEKKIDTYQSNSKLTFKDKNNQLEEFIYQLPKLNQSSLDLSTINLYLYQIDNHIRCLQIDNAIKIQKIVQKFRFIKSVLFYLKQDIILIMLYKSCYVMQILIYKNNTLEECVLIKKLDKESKMGLQKYFLSISPQLVFCQGRYEETILSILKKLGCKN